MVVWGLVVSSVYFWFIRSAPSCFDHVQNQGEQGADCGGPCATACTASAQEISVLGVNVFTSSPGHATFLAEVANTNAGFAAHSFGYTFNLYDVSGTLVGSHSGQSFLYASEIKYLLLPNILVSDPVDHATLTVESEQWVGGSALGAAPQFAFQNVSTNITSSSISVNGRIQNLDNAPFMHVLIIAVVKDAKGNPAGASETELDNLSPNQAQNFSVIYPRIENVNPAATQVEAYAAR